MEDSSRLRELKGRTEVISSTAARDYWTLGAIGSREGSWSEQLHGEEFSAERIPVFWAQFSWPAHPCSSTTLWYAEVIV